MATRGIIRFAKREEGVSFNEHPENVEVQIYKHYDTYPEGLGLDLAKFLGDFRVVNGLGKDEDKVANGMGCLAAQLIANLKTHSINRHGDIKCTPGNVYVENPDTKRTDLEYIYYIWVTENKSIWISMFKGFGNGDDFDCIFVGEPKKLIEKYTTKHDD